MAHMKALGPKHTSHDHTKEAREGCRQSVRAIVLGLDCLLLLRYLRLRRRWARAAEGD